MDSPLIRPATDADVPAIASIYSHYVTASTATFELDPPSESEMANRIAAVQSQGLPYLVAEHSQAIVGYAYAGPYRPRPAYRFTVEDSIYLAPGVTGQGIGSLLLGAVIERCMEGPWQQLIAVIGDSANEPSIRLHRKFGFRVAGTLTNVGFKFDRWIDTVLMQREVR